MCCSGVGLQHSQSASPYDIQVYNENLGLSVDHRDQPQTAEMVPDYLSSDRSRVHQHAAGAPVPPPAYDGAVPARSRASRSHVAAENGGTAAVDEKRLTDRRNVSARVYTSDQRTSVSQNVSTSAQFTSDISLATSNVTSYEDNGRQQKVSLLINPFVLVTESVYVQLCSPVIIPPGIDILM